MERRELTQTVRIESRYLQKSVHASILAQLRGEYEGKCSSEGFIQRRSILILDHSMGRTSLIRGGLEYQVRFQAEVCLPHPGQILTAKVTNISKIGVHAESLPLMVLLPRDIHIGNKSYEDIAEDQTIEFEVVGTKFQQGDESILVLGKFMAPVAGTPAADTEDAKPAEETQEEGIRSTGLMRVVVPETTTVGVRRKVLAKKSVQVQG